VRGKSNDVKKTELDERISGDTPKKDGDEVDSPSKGKASFASSAQSINTDLVMPSLAFDPGTRVEFIRTLAQLLNPSSSRGWIIVNYLNNKTVAFQASGNGGVGDLVQWLDDRQVQYILVRVPLPEKHSSTSKSRDVFIYWIGPEVSTLQKGQKRSHVGEVKSILQPFHSELIAVARRNFNEETIIRLSGPNAGTHTID